MPDFNWLCDACGTKNPAYTEVCRDCGFEYLASQRGIEKPMAGGQGEPDRRESAATAPEETGAPAQRNPRSALFRASVIAASICAAQVALTVLGFVVAPLSALQAIYFITALPAMVIAMVLGSWKGGILVWLSLSFVGYLVSLLAWAALYFGIAFWSIKRSKRRDEEAAPLPEI